MVSVVVLFSIKRFIHGSSWSSATKITPCQDDMYSDICYFPSQHQLFTHTTKPYPWIILYIWINVLFITLNVHHISVHAHKHVSDRGTMRYSIFTTLNIISHPPSYKKQTAQSPLLSSTSLRWVSFATKGVTSNHHESCGNIIDLLTSTWHLGSVSPNIWQESFF